MAATAHRPNPCADISSSSLITGELVDENLVIRRRLGKTNLSVKPSQIGTSNATKEGNLGLFEYAHLRVKLPEDLKGSEIFPSHASMTPPETYFLMVRYFLHVPNYRTITKLSRLLHSAAAQMGLSVLLECSRSHSLGPRSTRKKENANT